GAWISRLRDALRRTLPFWVCLFAYFVLWQIMFSDGVSGYDFAATAGALLDNYGRLLYTLFYGHRRVLFGIAYIVLLCLCARLLLRELRLAIIACLLIFIGFLPFVTINGFAHRFGYFSSMGFSLLLGLCFVSAIRSAGQRTRVAVAATALVICGFYAVEDRKIVREWKVAGQIAAQIPQTVRKLHPVPREGSILILRNVPRMYGRAMVYPTGLEEAVRRQYPVKVFVRHNGARLTDKLARSGARIYKYVGGDEVLIEIRAEK
ncbi:MAG TPA: hypothetical protein VFL57_21900, partial [Bryobacteraceae bacterium]|nr:hypothetical protein [Bryobacteraceae bacterium]